MSLLASVFDNNDAPLPDLPNVGGGGGPPASKGGGGMIGAGAVTRAGGGASALAAGTGGSDFTANGSYVGTVVDGVMIGVNSSAHLDSTPFCR